MRINT